jgi:hypothetical protein
LKEVATIDRSQHLRKLACDRAIDDPDSMLSLTSPFLLVDHFSPMIPFQALH